MFDEIMRELKKLEQGIQIPVDFPLDEEGYLDRECPAKSCQAEFKIKFQDWSEKIHDNLVFCPICGREAATDAWNTDEQIEYAKAVAVKQITGRVTAALQKDARRFNRQQRGGFIQMSMSVKPSTASYILPMYAADLMRQHFVCEKCGCQYSSVGAAFFCPVCRHNSAITTFEQTVSTARELVLALPSIREKLTSEFTRDLAQDSARHILEESIGRLVGAFQRVSEALFEQVPATDEVRYRKNVFQNLNESSKLWRRVIDKGCDDFLTDDELTEMNMLFQRRHLIAHRGGFVDEEYISKSEDDSYVIGQRLIIRNTDVLRLADLVLKLATALREEIGITSPAL